MATTDDIKMLFAEFPKEAISWRAQQVKKDGSTAMALAYIDARDVMDRLDSVIGAGEWQCDYPHAGTKTVCRIGIKVGDEWIWKSNGAGDSDIEAEKGALSDAFKRAAVLWGIGRYLYDMPCPWVPCEAYEQEWNGKKKMVWKRWRVDPWTMVKKAPGINIHTGRAASHALKKTPVWDEFQAELLECNSVLALQKFALAWSTRAEKENWPEEWLKTAKNEINDRKALIVNAPVPANDLSQHPIMAG